MKNSIKEDLQLFNQLISEFLEEEITQPVAQEVLTSHISEKLKIELTLDPTDPTTYKEILREVISKTPKSSSKLFFNQLYGGRHGKAVLGDLLTVFINNSMATYKIAGIQVGIEKEIIKQVCSLIGYNENFGGTLPTGGSMSNFMSLIMARDKADKNSKYTGNKSTLIAYTSENGHYSIFKNASFAGIGKNNIRKIPSNSKGQICVESLKRQIKIDIKQGLIPFYLNATAGTTVLCAFDPIQDLVKICKRNNIWIHVDGAFGGTVLFSKKYRKLISGVERTDSFCFNAHKTLGAPLSTSVLVVKNKEHLYNSFKNEAVYLYQTHDKEFNLGQTSFECGRRNNGLKLWSMWKAIGTKGIEKIINHEFTLANHAYNYLQKNKKYKSYSFKNSLSVCFNYQDFDPVDLCYKLYKMNTLMVGHGSFKKDKFIRLVTINSQNSKEDILNFFKILEEFCEKNQHKIKRL